MNHTHSLSTLETSSGLGLSGDTELDADLEAALQFLDETYGVEELYEEPLGPGQMETAPENSVTSNSSASDGDDSTELKTDKRAFKKITATKPKRRRRVTMKQHIANMHGTIEELTTRLETLKTERSEKPAVQQGSMNAHGDGSVVSRPLWQQIAARQLELRHQAEQDNAMLREMLNLQVQEAKNLKRILKRRTRIGRMEDMLGVKRLKTLPNDIPECTVQALEDMLRESDDIYAKLDLVYAERGMDEVPCPGKIRHANREIINGVFLEIMEKQLVPFPAKMTECAVWAAFGQFGMQSLQCVKDFNAQVDFHAQHSQKTNDTMMISYQAATSGFQNVRNIYIRKVVRKYVEADRTVFICHLISEPITLEGLAEISLSGKLCIVVQKAKDMQRGEGELALIQSCYIVSCHKLNDQSRELLSDGYIDVAITVWEEMMSGVSRVVESSLIDASF